MIKHEINLISLTEASIEELLKSVIERIQTKDDGPLWDIVIQELPGDGDFREYWQARLYFWAE